MRATAWHSQQWKNIAVCFSKLSSKELENYRKFSLSPGPQSFLWKKRHAILTTGSSSSCPLNNGHCLSFGALVWGCVWSEEEWGSGLFAFSAEVLRGCFYFPCHIKGFCFHFVLSHSLSHSLSLSHTQWTTNNLVKYVLVLSSFYRWRSWSSER